MGSNSAFVYLYMIPLKYIYIFRCLYNRNRPWERGMIRLNPDTVFAILQKNSGNSNAFNLHCLHRPPQIARYWSLTASSSYGIGRNT